MDIISYCVKFHVENLLKNCIFLHTFFSKITNSTAAFCTYYFSEKYKVLTQSFRDGIPIPKFYISGLQVFSIKENRERAIKRRMEGKVVNTIFIKNNSL